MFRGLLSYSIASISQSGQCSLQLQGLNDCIRVVITFWAGNVFNYFCLAEFPDAQLSAKKAIQVVSSYLSVPSKPPLVYSLLGFDARSAKTLTVELNQIPSICVVPTFGHCDLYKVLAGPTVKILDRFDYHSILQFLLMKLKTALEAAWLNNNPELRKVGLPLLSVSLCFSFHPKIYNLKSSSILQCFCLVLL